MATAKTAQKPPESDEFDFAPAWRPSEGESLRGTVVRRSKATSEFGEYIALTLRPVKGRTIHVQDPDGDVRAIQTEETDEVTVHCFGTVLDNALRRIRPRVGEEIAFKKLGKRLPRGMSEDKAKSTDWFNAWQVRLMSDRGDDDLYGAPERKREESSDDWNEPMPE